MPRTPDRKVKVLELLSTMHMGGAERVVQHLARYLDPQRFDVDVYCTHAMGLMAEELRELGHNVRCFDGRGKPLTVFKKLYALLREQRYDVVHTHSTSAFMDMAAVSLLPGSPVFVHTFHFGNYPHVKKEHRLFLNRLACRRTARMVAVSEAQRRSIIDHLGAREDRIQTIYNGVDENATMHDASARRAIRQELGVADDVLVAGCIAKMTEQKGIPHLIEAGRLLAATRHRVHFVVVGGGRLLDEMKERAAQAGIADRVTFTGMRLDVAALLAAFDVVVSSSLWEGFAMVLLEGMAARKPIVATDVGDNKQAIIDGETGLLVPAGDAAALAKAIAAIAENPARARDMANTAYELYQNRFTAHRMAEEHGIMYDRLLNISR